MTRFQKLFISADTPVFKLHFWGYFGLFFAILGDFGREKPFSTTIS